MKNALALLVTASLTLAACSSTTPSTQINQGNAPVAATGALKARVVLPYSIQTSSKVSSAGMRMLAFFAGQAARAEEVVGEGGGPLTEEQAQQLSVSVDGNAVTAQVNSVSSANGETVVEVTAPAVPAGDGNEVVEVTTSTGQSVGSVIVNAAPGTTTTTEVTTETTAVVEVAIEKHGSLKLSELSEAELAAIKADGKIPNLNASIRSAMKKNGAIKKKKHEFKQKGKSADAGKPSSPGKSADSSKPADAGKPAETGKPAEPGKPADAGKPDKAKGQG